MITDSTDSLSCLIYEAITGGSQPLRQQLQTLLAGQLVRVVDEIKQVEAKLREDDFSLLFLVVEQLDVDAFRFLNQLDYCPPVLVVSADRTVAADAYAIKAAGFIPAATETEFMIRQVREVLSQNRAGNPAVAMATARSLPFFFVKSDYKVIRLNFDDILFVEGLGEYLRIYTEANKYIVLQSFTRLMDVLPPHQFLRIHRSYMINLYKINFVQNNVVSIGNHQLPISKSQKKAFLELVEQVGLL
ncbi:LytTR family transcriptional regulator DNA-binding domain-containing protein [Spirosoma sp. SC4-14]|uniref:LytR/AlgR family response regulator transcription factor n=1 Tax=Spirosoma sp. SC4-14 TaxID=3128900 RepID=UPI0030D4B5D5